PAAQPGTDRLPRLLHGRAVPGPAPGRGAPEPGDPGSGPDPRRPRLRLPPHRGAVPRGPGGQLGRLPDDGGRADRGARLAGPGAGAGLHGPAHPGPARPHPAPARRRRRRAVGLRAAALRPGEPPRPAAGQRVRPDPAQPLGRPAGPRRGADLRARLPGRPQPRGGPALPGGPGPPRRCCQCAGIASTWTLMSVLPHVEMKSACRPRVGSGLTGRVDLSWIGWPPPGTWKLCTRPAPAPSEAACCCRHAATTGRMAASGCATATVVFAPEEPDVATE